MKMNKNNKKLNDGLLELLNSLAEQKFSKEKKDCNNCKRLNALSLNCCYLDDEERKEIGYVCNRHLNKE